jgi:hypothetical protein
MGFDLKHTTRHSCADGILKLPRVNFELCLKPASLHILIVRFADTERKVSVLRAYIMSCWQFRHRWRLDVHSCVYIRHS